MEEMEKMVDLMTQKITEPGTGDGFQGPWSMHAASWTTLERYAKYYTYKIPVIIVKVIGVIKLEGGRGKEVLVSCFITWVV